MVIRKKIQLIEFSVGMLVNSVVIVDGNRHHNPLKSFYFVHSAPLNLKKPKPIGASRTDITSFRLAATFNAI
ncbi:MAG: hypothetical protein JHC61_09930 [Burkholderiaceae bacterium]|nr:hypothetical protein [Burkholderiaceae bacterium]